MLQLGFNAQRGCAECLLRDDIHTSGDRWLGQRLRGAIKIIHCLQIVRISNTCTF